MRAVVQRVTEAKVTVAGEMAGRVERGLLVLVGVGREDSQQSAETLAHKVVSLRIFEDDAGRMNQSVTEVGGAILAVSQFTLYGDVRKGRRPSFGAAMAPQLARELFDHFCVVCRGLDVRVETGRFQEHMSVELTNDGPVTILIDTERTF